MSEGPRCPQCGAQLLVDGKSGLCPNCSGRLTFQTVPHSTTPGDGSRMDHGAIRIPCPHCGNRIPILEPYPTEITCTSCGSAFHVEPGSTIDTRQQLPKAIGKFQIQELLGRGGFGAVYRAHDPELDRMVAIKVPRAGSFASQEEEERFLREARSAARLKHPGIVSVHEIGEESGLPYIVSDYIDGLTLADVITGGRLTFRESAELVAQIADALDFAHHQKIVHRDIKPGNILIDDAGRPHIADFGLARREEGEITVTLDGQILGTPAYMAPEQASGELHKVTAQSDLYSLGVVLYELLTGELPFRGNRRMLIHQVLHDEPRPPRRLNDRIPRDLETICLKAMAKEPTRRYASARDLADDLRRHLKGEPIHARPITMVERAWRWSGRRPAVAGLLATLFVVITASLAGLATLWQQADRRRQDAETAQAAESKAKALAQQHLATARWNLYLSKIQLARQDLQEGHVTRAKELLESMNPASEEPDLRGFEWNYLSCLCRLAPPTLDAGDGPAGMAYSPDGRWLAVAGSRDSHRVYVWDATRGQRQWTLVDPTMIPWSVSFSRDSRWLASSGYDTKVRVWDLQSGKQISAWELPTQPKAITFSPVENQLAVGEAGHAALREPATGKVIAALPLPHWDRVHSLSYSRDGQRLAAALNGSIVIWDVPTRKIFRTVRASQSDPPALSPDGHLLAYALTPDDIAVHNLLTHQTFILRGLGPAGFSMVWSPDGSRLATTTLDGMIHVWDVATQHEELALSGHGDMFQRLAFSPDGLQLVSTSIDGPIRFWRLSGAEAAEHRLGPVQVQSPDQRRYFTGYATPAPKAWDAISGKELFTFESVPGKVLQLVCSPDGTVLAGLESKPGNDWAVVLWETASGRLLHTLPSGQGSANGHLSFSPDGQLLATTKYDQKREERVERHAAFTTHTSVVTSEQSKVELWRVADGHCLIRWACPSSRIDQLAFTPNGRQLLATTLAYTGESSVVLWEAATGRKVWQMRAATSPQHMFPVLAISRDGRFAAVSTEGSVLMLETATGRELHRLMTRGHTRPAFSADGSRLIAEEPRLNEMQHAIKIWDTSTGQEMLALGGTGPEFQLTRMAREGYRVRSPLSRPSDYVDWDVTAHSAEVWRERDAALLVRLAFARSPWRDDVLHELRHLPIMDEAVRAEALDQAQRQPMKAPRLNEAAWAIVRTPKPVPAALRKALAMAQEACRLAPKEGFYVNTLGVAHYRLGHYDKALETLCRSEKMNRARLKTAHPVDLAFLAMSANKLGKTKDSSEYLDRLRRALKLPQWAKDAEAMSFLHEAETQVEQNSQPAKRLSAGGGGTQGK